MAKFSDLARLKTVLLTSGIQQKNPALFQVVSQLVDSVREIQIETSKLGIATIGITNLTQIQQIIALSGDGDGDGDPFVVPGPRGETGISNVPGPIGPMGTIIFPPDAEDGDIFPPQQGPQGNPGPTGSQGPLGPVIIDDDYIPDELPSNPISLPIIDKANFSIAKVNITDAEFRSLNTAPKNLGIPAPGANRVIVPIVFAIIYELASIFSANPTWNVRPVGGTSTHFVSIGAQTNGVLAKKISKPITAAIQTNVNLTTTGQIDTQWEVFTSANVTGGSTTAGFNFYFWHSIIELP